MIVHGNEVTYPSNPFAGIQDDRLLLKNTVSIYISDVDLFEPQIDFSIDQNGIPHFIFGGEWVAPYNDINCVETQISSLPVTFLEDNLVYYQVGEERVHIKPIERIK